MRGVITYWLRSLSPEVTLCLLLYPTDNVKHFRSINKDYNWSISSVEIVTLFAWSNREISRVSRIHNTTKYIASGSNPDNTRRWPNVGLMLGQRRRRWASVSPTLGQCFVFAGKGNSTISSPWYSRVISGRWQLRPFNTKVSTYDVSSNSVIILTTNKTRK